MVVAALVRVNLSKGDNQRRCARAAPMVPSPIQNNIKTDQPHAQCQSMYGAAQYDVRSD